MRVLRVGEFAVYSAPKCSAEVLSTVPKGKKAVIDLLEKHTRVRSVSFPHEL